MRQQTHTYDLLDARATVTRCSTASSRGMRARQQTHTYEAADAYEGGGMREGIRMRQHTHTYEAADAYEGGGRREGGARQELVVLDRRMLTHADVC